MELDLDSFLQLQSSDEDEEEIIGVHRTVDEILNDTDDSSSSSSSSSELQLRPVFAVNSSKQVYSSQFVPEIPIQSDSRGNSENSGEISELSVAETIKSIKSEENIGVDSQLNPRLAESKIGVGRRRAGLGEFVAKSSPGSFSLGRSNSTLPTLFGGFKPNPKPGAALAAAAAASRSIPTPHAAAIKFRRTHGALQKIPHPEESVASVGDSETVFEEFDGFHPVSHDRSSDVGEIGRSDNGLNGVGSDISHPDADLDREGDNNDNNDADNTQNWENFPSSIVEPVVGLYSNGEIFNEDQAAELVGKSDEFCSIKEAKADQGEAFQVNDIQLRPEEDLDLSLSDSTAVVEQQIVSYGCVSELIQNSPMSSSETHDLERLTPVNDKDGEVNVGEEGEKLEPGGQRLENNSVTDSTEIVEDRLVHLESKRSNKKSGKKSRSSMKPLELAEELEKKYASSGLHWEEGAAAQPMRLEGIRRGPPAVGYLQIDPDNAISRAILSQGPGRDHGSTQVLAVHLNYIAVGMSKGLVLVAPSKYSVHSADNMDSKVLMLGSQEKSPSPVTSMCFNQQGDLLLVGYGNGHLTVWDVQKATAAKTITGEHTVPIVHTLFLGQDSQVTRQFKAVSGDSKGLVLLHAFSVVPLLNRFSIKTQCLLDGQRTGTVLSASPLLIDDPLGGGFASAQGSSTVSPGGLGSMVGGVVGGVVGGEAGWRLFSDGSSMIEEGVVIFVTYQTALVVRLSPTLEVYAQLSKPDGVREGSMPYTAWKCVTNLQDHMNAEALDKASLLALAWDRKVLVAKLVKSDLKIYREWNLDSAAIGVAWLDDEMLVVLTLKGQLCLFSKEGTELHWTSFVVCGSGGEDIITYHTHFTNVFGNPEKAYHNSIAVRGASIYILGPTHLVVSRLLPWKERIQVLQKAGDWMGALDMAMGLYDGQAHGVIDLPRTVDAIREAIMPFLVELLLAYVDEVFSYISVAFCNQIGKLEEANESKIRGSSMHLEIEEQFARVGGVALEFCVHINRVDVLFDTIFSKFVAVQHGGTFLELLEPYILKDMLGCLPPEIMQALVEHYSGKGWLQRVEQCVLHMDISSLDFNQVVRLCREHGLYGALIYLFNRGLDDFKAPLEELLVVVQNSQRDAALSIGYRMLVYLKYCFLGFAFPPGHGTLLPSRLPLLRTELLQFLLEDSSTVNSQTVTSFRFPGGVCPNLFYLLWLDTEATLEVIRYAFLEAELVKSENSLHDMVDTSVEDSTFHYTESQSLMAQNIVDTLIRILDMEASGVLRSSGTNDNGSFEVWPSRKELGHLFEFIAFFVACQSATVPKGVLNRILEHLTIESGLSTKVSDLKLESFQRREKQVLALLKVVPETDWDSSYMLQLCQEAQFYQVCSLIHMNKGQYLAALDSYMKDTDEPIHAFAFINNMLLELRDAESSAFWSAVISRIPELVNLSREGAFFLVVDHFSKESQQILSELRSHPKSLFLYLKTTIDVHLSGTLNFSSLVRGDALDDPPCGKNTNDQSKEHGAYLERISNFPKLFRLNSIHVTDEMAELYLELLCQFEPKSVLKFLETFENYRLEHCLRLCQEYGVTDAAAFLLERVGDVGSALSLTVLGIYEKLAMVDIAVENIVSKISSSRLSEMEQLNSILRLKEVEVVHDLLHASVGLCQRNTRRLDPQESMSLWFKLLDSFCDPLRDLYTDRKVSGSSNHADRLAMAFSLQGNEEDEFRWRISKFDKGVHILRRVISQFIGEIVEGMVGYVPLPTIMAKLLSDNGSQEFGDFKLTILGMLGTYGYERRILDTAKNLIEDDTFYTMSLLKKGASHAYTPQSLICCLCNCSLTKESSTSSIRVFNCGHATHFQCEFQENEALKKDSSAGCPICMPKKKNTRAKSKSVLTEKGLVKNYPSKPQQSQGLTNIESDFIEKPYGIQQMSRFEILRNLQKGQRSLQIDILPQLRLAPPAIYHEKVKKNTEVFRGETSSTPVKNEKPSKNRHLRELKTKGSTFQFPLRSNIFSNEKNKRR